MLLPLAALPPPCPQGQALYLAQEYCLTDLSALLRRASCPPAEGVAKGVMRQLLRGLEALHAEGEGREGRRGCGRA